MKLLPSRTCAFVAFLMTLSCSAVSCNDDDDKIPSFPVPEGELDTGELDSIQVTFSLLNSKGERTKTFSSGEDIIFDLTILNKRSQTFWYGSYYDLLGDDMFRVFTEKGMPIGTSWHYPEEDVLIFRGIAPLSEKHWQCPWLSSSSTQPSSPFILNDKNRTLSKGKYYAVAPVHIGEQKDIVCTKQFEIR